MVNAEAVRVKARGDLQKAADKHEAFRVTCSLEPVDSQREAAIKSGKLESELAEARKHLGDAPKSNYKTFPPRPQKALAAAQRDERVQQAGSLTRKKVGVHAGQIGGRGQGGGASVRDSRLVRCPAVERVVDLFSTRKGDVSSTWGGYCCTAVFLTRATLNKSRGGKGVCCCFEHI